MSAAAKERAIDKMVGAGVSRPAVDVFAGYYEQLEAGASGFIAEESIEPLTAPDLIADVHIDASAAKEALAATAIIKLNGGLGTSMGMDKAKSLLPVRDGKSFLDLIVGQVRAARSAYEVRLPLIFMNSFRTRDDTLAALGRYDDLVVDGLPLDFVQSQEPKLRADDLAPVQWPADPALEWCPPGHGDLYPSLLASGVVQRLIDLGFRYASVSNADNLGAGPDATLAGWFAQSSAPYAAEICRRTAADRKGGHLAIRKVDRQLILRDTAQTRAEEMGFFTDEHRHPFFHCNNLWFDLQVLSDTLTDRGGVLGLPLIRNHKTVDPADSGSPEVVQIESAMGAAVEVFPGAAAIGVSRERFLPVKTTNDLLLLRSDVYEVASDNRLAHGVTKAPLVELDPPYYKTIRAFEQRFPDGPPSLRDATHLAVRGDWTFGANVRVRGAVSLPDTGHAMRVPAGSTIDDRTVADKAFAEEGGER